ncbi:MAG TPA: polyprenol monophosphomannose synthase [Methyloceanibacter sp.]|nr:polyprenol monophosphomannose synthase [Methyloceanibacter sp.]
MKNGEISGESASRRVSAPTGAADISIVVPTLNEADNIKPFIAAIKRVLEPFNWEIVFVDDDSPDGTWKTVQHEAAHDRRIRGIRRVGRHGLASAAIEGFLSSASPVLVLMDGDLQHEEAILPQMISLIADDHADLVVGSRYLPGGSAAGLSQRHRSWLSFLGLKLAQIGLRTGISDPMSGFFAVKRSVVDVAAPNLSGQGFKILADILASAPGPMRIKEIPYVFRQRAAGESKLEPSSSFNSQSLSWTRPLAATSPRPSFFFRLSAQSECSFTSPYCTRCSLSEI